MKQMYCSVIANCIPSINYYSRIHPCYLTTMYCGTYLMQGGHPSQDPISSPRLGTPAAGLGAKILHLACAFCPRVYCTVYGSRLDPQQDLMRGTWAVPGSHSSPSKLHLGLFPLDNNHKQYLRTFLHIPPPPIATYVRSLPPPDAQAPRKALSIHFQAAGPPH